MTVFIMKITLSQYAGFCDGVDRAYKIVEKISKDKEVKKPIFILGSLVHNKEVVEKIEKLGIKKINRDEFQNKKIATLIITAHGVGPDIYSFCNKRNIDIVDVTCPKVLKVQRLAKVFFERKNNVIIIGDKNHKEVKGIFEWAGKKAKIISGESDLKKIKFNPEDKVFIISQTTQNQDFVKEIFGKIKKKYKKAEFINTLCITTYTRQNEVKILAKKNDAMIVIGSPESANSNRLWEIAREINPKAYFIEKAFQIKKSWLKNCQKIGITAGASTPDWTIKEVLIKLKVI